MTPDKHADDPAADEISEPSDGPGADLDADEGEPDIEAFQPDESGGQSGDEQPSTGHGYGYE